MNALVDPDRSEWDVIVLGGAAAGENAAQHATQFSGLDAVIVEKDLVGGECSYWACMPSKALLRPVEMLSVGRDLPGVSELIGDRDLDTAAVLARRDRVVKHLDDSSQVQWALGAGLGGERPVAERPAGRAGGDHTPGDLHRSRDRLGSSTTWQSWQARTCYATTTWDAPSSWWTGQPTWWLGQPLPAPESPS
jgi:dihydrolipoamide dehydrogenase